MECPVPAMETNFAALYSLVQVIEPILVRAEHLPRNLLVVAVFSRAERFGPPAASLGLLTIEGGFSPS